jgi:flagellin-like hook-associated protein FlgL
MIKVKKKLVTIFLLLLSFILNSISQPVHAASNTTVSGFLLNRSLTYGQQVYVGSIYADAGNYIIALTGLNWGLTQNSNGTYNGSTIYDGYTYHGYYELKIVDDQNNAIYDKIIYPNNYGRELTTIMDSINNLQFNPTTKLDFYITNALWEDYAGRNVTYLQYYVLLSSTNYTIGQATISQADKLAVQTQQYAQQAATNAQQAATAANNTMSYAQQAQQAAINAQNAANQVNTIVNSTLTTAAGVVQDSSGTVLTAARAAQAAAQNAVTGISNISSKIDANQNALTNQLNNLQNTVTNNFNNLSQFLTPSLKKISGFNGATATSGTSIRLILDYSNATDYRYSIDGGAWSLWNPLTGNQISVPLGSPGAHTITVQVRNGSSPTCPTDQASLSVFKI